MITIAIVSQKGGSGKTTLAVHLANAASAAGKVACIIDTDPQATAAAWQFRGHHTQSPPSNAHTGASNAAASLCQVAAEPVPPPFSIRLSHT